MLAARTLLFALAIACSVHGTAQSHWRDFPIDSFVLPDIDRKTLSLNGSLSGGYFTSNSDIIFNAVATQFSGRNTLGASHTRFVNNDSLQLQATLSGSFFINYLSERPQQGSKVRDTRLSTSAGSTIARRNYRGERFRLFGLAADARYTVDRDAQPEDGLKDALYLADAQIALQIGRGTGRIEPLDDVVTAIYVLDDLGQLVPFSTDPGQVLDFAETMARVRNARLLDFRKQRMHELRSLFTFLDQAGWVTPGDPVYYATVTDNWLYAFRSGRGHGRRWTYGLEPTLAWDHNRNKDILPEPAAVTFTRNDRGFAALLFAAYDKEEARDLYWQANRSHSLHIGYAYSREKTMSPQFTSDSKSDGIVADFSNEFLWGYFPNSRTRVSAAVRVDMVLYYEDGLQYAVSPRTSLSAGYFLSYRARLSASANLWYVRSNGGTPQLALDTVLQSFETSRFNGSLGVGLVVDVY